METAMSNPRRSHLPPEMLDYTIDLLHNEQETLKRCCLVSKSWVPRTRKYLFAHIRFQSLSDLRAWKETFPDPENSPAYHTHSLLVSYPRGITAEEGDWIRMFSSVVRLAVVQSHRDEPVSLVPFHNFSPVLKSLRVFSYTFPYSQILNLVYSMPLLEDLCVIEYGSIGSHRDGTVFQPSTSPVFTGTLKLFLTLGMEHITRRLLGLPNGLHFRKLVFTWHREEHVRWMTALVVGCSDTLECVDIGYSMTWNHRSGPIDFSEATKLKEVVFRPTTDKTHVLWVTKALQTITSKHMDLQRITIHVRYHSVFIAKPTHYKQTTREKIHREWVDLDRLLIQFWESRTVRPRIICQVGEKQKKPMWERIGDLLPGVTERGITELVDSAESREFW